MINPDNANADSVTHEAMGAASTLGVQIELMRARDSLGIDAAFVVLVRNKAEGLLAAADPFFFSRRQQLAMLSARHALPAIYNVREYAEAGGLISYGTSLTEVFRQVGSYAARILKGARPDELPVVQSTKFELILNLSTARALGLQVPSALLARADEVIE